MKYFILITLLMPFVVFCQEDLSHLSKKGIDIEGHIPKGLIMGDKAPEINLVSTKGKLIKSSELLKTKQLVIIFYRGKWCPVCEKYLSNLNDSLSYILDNDAQVLVIGPETYENAEKMADKTKADFILIPDTSMQIQKAYDVMFNVTKKYQTKINTFLLTDIAKNNNQNQAKLPVPATYIVGQDGNIKWRHFDYNYSRRASAREIIDNLK